MVPKPPLPAGAAELPNVKGDGAVLPNTELLVPLLVVWVVAPKPEVVAAPKENTDVVLPKAGCVLAGVPKAEAVGFKPNADCAVLPKAGWAGAAGAAAGVGAEAFPKEKELPKLGARAGLVAPCCCPSAAPNAGWGVAPGYGGGALVLAPKGMLNAGLLVLLNVSVGWLAVPGVDAVRLLPKALKPPLLLAAACPAPGRGWPKVVTAAEAGMAGGLPNWNMGPMAGVKLAPEAGGVPKRKGWDVDVVVLVTLPMALVTVLTPKPKVGFEADSVEVLAVVTEATAEVAPAWPVNRGTPEVVAGVV